MLTPHADPVPLVLALPRGGVCVAAEVARMLEAPLELVLVRKLGHPANPEYAVGAVAEDGPALYNEAERALLCPAWQADVEREARNELARRNLRYRGQEGRPPEVDGRVVILVDDGIATGLTMEAAVRSVRDRGAAAVIVAVPVAAADSVERLRRLVDSIVVADNPRHFLGAVGAHYRRFPQIGDEQVVRLLRGAHHEISKHPHHHENAQC